MKHLTLILSLAGVAALAAPADAQGRRQGGERERGPDSIPAQYRPPPGMCRIWITGVPAGQQPAPTDCATAVRNRPPNGRVIFGPAAPRSKSPEPKQKSEPPTPIPPRRPIPPG